MANAQKTRPRPATSPRTTATIGVSDISTIREAASTVMAHAPIATQYGGVRSTGRSG